MFHSKHAFARDERRKMLKLELEIRNALYRLSALIVIMKNELGLIPVRLFPLFNTLRTYFICV